MPYVHYIVEAFHAIAVFAQNKVDSVLVDGTLSDHLSKHLFSYRISDHYAGWLIIWVCPASG